MRSVLLASVATCALVLSQSAYAGHPAALAAAKADALSRSTSTAHGGAGGGGGSGFGFGGGGTGTGTGGSASQRSGDTTVGAGALGQAPIGIDNCIAETRLGFGVAAWGDVKRRVCAFTLAQKYVSKGCGYTAAVLADKAWTDADSLFDDNLVWAMKQDQECANPPQATDSDRLLRIENDNREIKARLNAIRRSEKLYGKPKQ